MPQQQFSDAEHHARRGAFSEAYAAVVNLPATASRREIERVLRGLQAQADTQFVVAQHPSEAQS